MYLDGFRETPLVTMSDDAEALADTLPRGTGFRCDGVGSPWHEANWIGSKKYAGVPGFAEQWKRAPVVFEWYGPYEYLVQRGWSFERALEATLRLPAELEAGRYTLGLALVDPASEQPASESVAGACKRVALAPIDSPEPGS